MKIKESLKEHLIACLLQTMLGLIGLLFLTILAFFSRWGLVPKVEDLNPVLLSKVILLLLVTCSFLMAYIIYSHPKYKLRFAVKWDKKGNPYCPTLSCESPMYEFSHDSEGSTISCPICEKSNIQLKHEDGRYIFIEEARLMIAKHLKLDEIRKNT